MDRDARGKVKEAIVRGERFFVTCHANPDGDAVGSLLAASRILQLLGKQDVTLYCPDGVPECYRFLPQAELARDEPVGPGPFDVTWILDVGDPSLLGPHLPAPSQRGLTVVVDHHLRHKDFGDVVWRDPDASATGILLWRLAHDLGLGPDQTLAECLWCAVYTDTGGFRYSSTNPEALRAGAELLEWGVDAWKMAVEIYEMNPPERIKLLGDVLQTLEIRAGGKVAAITVTEEMLRATGLSHAMLDTFINYPRSIRGVEVAIQFAERDGGIKVGFRSKGAVDVSAVAERFGGGGHRNAAGCRIEADMATAKEMVFRAVETLFSGA